MDSNVDTNFVSEETGTPSESAPISAPAPLDQSVLDRLRALQREGRPSILRKLGNAYFEASSEVLETLRDAVTGDDAKGIWQMAHKLRSSSLNLGASELAKHCKELESLGESGSTEGAARVFSRIEAEYERACAALNAELDGEPE